MADFVQDINLFTRTGIFNYQFDEVGNIILNPSSSIFQQHYVSVDLATYQYDDAKITSFYDVNFVEFQKVLTPTASIDLPQDVKDQILLITDQNQQLQDQLDQLIAASEVSSTQIDEQVVKDIIITLRIQLGQGQSGLDFSQDFPYLPISIDQQDTAPSQ